MQSAPLEEIKATYLRNMESFKLKQIHMMGEFLGRRNKRCVLIETENTSLVVLSLIEVFKALVENPTTSVEFEPYLSPENQLFLEWQQLVDTTGSQGNIPRLRNLVVVEITKDDSLEGQEAFFRKLRRYVERTVGLKIIIVSRKNDKARLLMALFDQRTSENSENDEVIFSGEDPVEETAPIYRAALNGDIDSVIVNLNRDRTIVDQARPNGQTALHIAALAGHMNIVKLLVERGAVINIKDAEGNTPAHLAASNNHQKIVHYLLDKWNNLQTGNGYGKRLIHIAAEKGYKALLLQLIQRGASSNVIDRQKRSPLHLAAENRHLYVCLELLTAGVDVNAQDDQGMTALHVAVKTSDTFLMGALVRHTADLSRTDRSGHDVLYYAVESGNLDIVTFLLGFKPEISLSVLHLATSLGHLEIIKVLVSQGADINAKDNRQLSSLFYAIQSGKRDVVEWLLENGANIFEVNVNGCTAMHCAALQGSLEMVQMLERAGLNVHQTTEASQSTVLHYAAQSGSNTLIAWLLNQNLDKNVSNAFGETPLHIAVKGKKFGVVLVLLRHGADPNMMDTNGRRPLHWAAQLGCIRMINLLLKNGAEVNAVDARGCSAMRYAIESRQRPAVRILARHRDNVLKKTKKGRRSVASKRAQIAP